MEPLENYSSHTKRVVLLLLEKNPQKKRNESIPSCKTPASYVWGFFHQKASCKAFAACSNSMWHYAWNILPLLLLPSEEIKGNICMCVCHTQCQTSKQYLYVSPFLTCCLAFLWAFLWSPKLSSYIFLTLQFYGTFCKITTSASAVVNTVTTKIFPNHNLQISKNLLNYEINLQNCW